MPEIVKNKDPTPLTQVEVSKARVAPCILNYLSEIIDKVEGPEAHWRSDAPQWRNKLGPLTHLETNQSFLARQFPEALVPCRVAFPRPLILGKDGFGRAQALIHSGMGGKDSPIRSAGLLPGHLLQGIDECVSVVSQPVQKDEGAKVRFRLVFAAVSIDQEGLGHIVDRSLEERDQFGRLRPTELAGGFRAKDRHGLHPAGLLNRSQPVPMVHMAYFVSQDGSQIFFVFRFLQHPSGYKNDPAGASQGVDLFRVQDGEMIASKSRGTVRS